MKTGKRILSIFMAVLMLLTAAPLAGFVGIEIAPKAEAYSVGDHIQFGTYPQTRVDETPELQAAANAATWKSYNYYAGTGSEYDGNMMPSDCMQFVDFFCGSIKYRAVRIIAYRPFYTGFELHHEGGSQSRAGYTVNHTYYFKYEPLSWRVLDPSEGYIMCENIIDSQAYQNTIYYEGESEYYQTSEYYQAIGSTVYANDYATSSIRTWLNYDFYETAFALSQKSKIKMTSLNNDAYNINYAQYNSAPTNDKIFLLSMADVLNTSYGFLSKYYNFDHARRASGTDYARCQGLDNNRTLTSGFRMNSWWWLRSPGGNSHMACFVKDTGETNSNEFVGSADRGVRPACKLSNLSSDTSQSESLFSNLDPLNGFGVDNIVDTKRIDFDILEDREKDKYVHGYVDSIHFNSAWFFQNAKKYNHELCQFCSQFSMLGYAKKDQLENALKAVGFTVDKNYVNLRADRDEVNYFIVSKEITAGSETKTLIFAGFIGSYLEQWNSNFDPYGWHRKHDYAGNDEKGDVHLGFADARQFVLGRLNQFIRYNQIERSDIKLLLTGHSRGAATANLLAGKLIEQNLLVDSGNLYAYTFATPRGAKKDGKLNEKFGCIFNIVNPEDFVTKVLPYAWGFHRYGNVTNGSTYVLPSKTNEAKDYSVYKKAMQVYYAKFTSDSVYSPFPDGEETVYKLTNKFTNKVRGLSGFYETKYNIDTGDYRYPLSSFSFFKDYICPFVNGTPKEDQPSKATMGKAALLSDSPFSDFIRFFINNHTLSKHFDDGHKMQTYCAYVMSMKETDMEYREGIKGEVYCPVDIDIIDKETNEVVGRIVDNVVDEEIFAKENSVVMSVDGDEKSFWLPSNGDYEVKLIGNDTGKMDYTLARIDSDMGELSRANFFDVSLTDGLTYTSEVGGEAFSTETYSLICETGTEIQPDETFGEENAVKYNVTVSADENGTASGDGIYTSGDYATVSALPNEGYEFDGWYTGETLVSSETTYRFRVDSDVALTAKFKLQAGPHTHTYASSITTQPTCTTNGIRTYTCTSCAAGTEGHSYTEKINALGHAYVNHAAKEPTCEEPGWDAYQTCSRCSYTTFAEKEALGHIDEDEDGYCDREDCGEPMEGADLCPYCGKVHKGFFQKIIGFFHKIIYKLTHLFKKDDTSAKTNSKK